MPVLPAQPKRQELTPEQLRLLGDAGPPESVPGLGDDATGRFAIERVASELSTRWSRACAEALAPIGGEDALVSLAAADLEAVLRRAFDNGLALGRSFCRHYAVVLEQHDLAWLLPRLGDCASGRELLHCGGTSWLQRMPCTSVSAARCAFYREALDGLVLGLSDGEIFFRRHRAGATDSTCLDVCFAAATGSDAEKYGPIPVDMADALAQVAAGLKRLPGIGVRFVGLSEGVLSFVVEVADSELAADAAVERAVKRRFASLTTRNLAPRGVLGGAS